MPIKRVSKKLNDEMFFVTMTIRNWYKILNEKRWGILSESIEYCQKNKGLKIYSYVFMLNHIHMIIRAPDVSGFIRDFKSFAAKKTLTDVKKENTKMIKKFQCDDKTFELWKKGNYPEIIETDWFLNQKINYIHYNPVKKGYVQYPEEWKWSSANFFENEEKGPIIIEPLEI